MGSEVTWPAEFADFKRLDAVLKCGICYDYMTNCMITSCSHTYCSLCIRKFMQYKNQCPACFEETYEVHLRNNRPLDEVITIFVKMKDKLQRALRLATIPIPIKETKTESLEEPKFVPKTPKAKSVFAPKTPSLIRSKQTDTCAQLDNDQNKESTATAIEATAEASDTPKTPRTPKTPSTLAAPRDDNAGEDVVFHGVKIPGIFNAPIVFPKARKPEEMAKCPVCQVEVPARNINMHLDSCLAVESEVCLKKVKAPKKRDPLPKRLYHLMQDKALKKILKDYGLNTQGDRKTLISRIQRYTVIYNSENDSPTPRPVFELIAQLEREEREEKKPNALLKTLTKAPPQRITVDRKADPEVIEQANKTYRDENKDSFKKLIEQMRAREGKNIKPSKPPPRVYSDDDDDPNTTIDVRTFDPNMPSTSKDDHDSHSVYSQATQSGMSDSDVFVEDDCDQSSEQGGLIDWNKTRQGDEDDEDDIIISEEESPAYSPTPKRPPSLVGRNVTPGSVPIKQLHILVSPCKLSDENTRDAPIPDTVETSLNDSSEKENRNDENTRTSKDTDANAKAQPPENVKLIEREMESNHDNTIDLSSSQDSIDALFEQSKLSVDPATSPRLTRSRNKSKGQSSTPMTVASSRGAKRKSDDSPEKPTPNNLQDRFNHLFNNYNGDRVNEDVESDNESTVSSSEALNPEVQEDGKETPVTRRSRRSLRNQPNPTPPEETNKIPKVTRKRAKRDLSPAF